MVVCFSALCVYTFSDIQLFWFSDTLFVYIFHTFLVLFTDFLEDKIWNTFLLIITFFRPFIPREYTITLVFISLAPLFLLICICYEYMIYIYNNFMDRRVGAERQLSAENIWFRRRNRRKIDSKTLIQIQKWEKINSFISYPNDRNSKK